VFQVHWRVSTCYSVYRTFPSHPTLSSDLQHRTNRPTCIVIASHIGFASILYILCFIRILTVSYIVHLFLHRLIELHVSRHWGHRRSHPSFDHSAITSILSFLYRFSCSMYIPEYPFVFRLYLHRFDRLHRITCVQLAEHIDRRIQALISSHFVRYWHFYVNFSILLRFSHILVSISCSFLRFSQSSATGPTSRTPTHQQCHLGASWFVSPSRVLLSASSGFLAHSSSLGSPICICSLSLSVRVQLSSSWSLPIS
jgi:hypothetical protein